MNPLADAKSTDSNWDSLYKLGGVAALFMVAITLAQGVSFAVAPPPLKGNAGDWFALFQKSVFLGLLGFEVLPSSLCVALRLGVRCPLRCPQTNQPNSHSNLPGTERDRKYGLHFREAGLRDALPEQPVLSCNNGCTTGRYPGSGRGSDRHLPRHCVPGELHPRLYYRTSDRRRHAAEQCLQQDHSLPADRVERVRLRNLHSRDRPVHLAALRYVSAGVQHPGRSEAAPTRIERLERR